MQNNLNFLPDECWFGGAVTDGVHQPYTAKSTCVLDLSTNRTPNQMMPLLLSTKGRWLWNPNGMRIQFEHGRLLYYTSGTQCGQSGNTLRSAYLDAMTRFFPFSADGPARLFLDAPVYNTWIELTFHQTQKAVYPKCFQRIQLFFHPRRCIRFCHIQYC